MRPDETHHRAEHRLLWCCASKSLDPERASRLRALLGLPLDWEYVLRVARSHCVVPLLARHLAGDGERCVPTGVETALRDAARSNARRNLRLLLELQVLLDGFRVRAVPVLAFKGPLLALEAYGDLTLRQFGDLDLLVPRSRLREAEDQLLSLGYRSVVWPHAARHAATLGVTNHLLFVREQLEIELHWELVPHPTRGFLKAERLWERLKPVSIAGRPAWTFGPEDGLLFLCLHGCKHDWERLAWVVDVAEWIRAHPWIEWDGLLDRAAAARSRRALRLGLALARNIAGLDLPDRVLASMREEPSLEPMALAVRKRMFQERPGSRDSLEAIGLRLRTSDGISDGARFLVRRFVMPSREDWEPLPLPLALFPLYFLTRPARLAAKYGRRLARIVRPATVPDALRSAQDPGQPLRDGRRDEGDEDRLATGGLSEEDPQVGGGQAKDLGEQVQNGSVGPPSFGRCGHRYLQRAVVDPENPARPSAGLDAEPEPGASGDRHEIESLRGQSPFPEGHRGR